MVFEQRGKAEYPEKNRQQTEFPYVVVPGIRHGAIMMGDKCSYQSPISLNFKCVPLFFYDQIRNGSNLKEFGPTFS